MKFSRNNPSDRYLYLQSMYRQMHLEGEPGLGRPAEVTFAGFSLAPQIGRIRELIRRTGAQSILDYGSGKGKQYEPRELADGNGGKWSGVAEYWGIQSIVCYDPCYPPYSDIPTDMFDGVISTDVLEHCPEEDIGWILDEIFGFAKRFVFANVACYPAKKVLPNGENAHCMIKPLDWWRDTVSDVAARNPGVIWEFWIQHTVTDSSGVRIVEEKIKG